MLFLASAVKLIAEIALMAFVGQWLLGLIAGRHRDSNLFYQIFCILTRPFVKAARLISPRIVIDAHVPLVAFLLLALAWVVATLTVINICVEIGVQACR
ncbi:hypothetical protein [Caldimonas thermodepolymerans]|uniref:hypothetical protein n=1 Tax=Caldimonas thermodepolymerans TaxID=215580 RepID=UPI0022359803|nr:hypothetical protein [Caldimonas thermodepolymerans]UZG42853.1 hypothetical protein ONZ46_10450 [Caldimonas thermodepolymerans]